MGSCERGCPYKVVATGLRAFVVLVLIAGLLVLAVMIWFVLNWSGGEGR